jgi:protoporphyrinogen oxidase
LKKKNLLEDALILVKVLPVFSLFLSFYLSVSSPAPSHRLSDEEYLWEEGANSFQPNLPFLEFLRDIGLLDELVLANSSLPRYIVWGNELHPLPSSLSQLYSSKLLTWRGKLALVSGLFGFVKRKPKDEESIEEFVTRHFGPSLLCLSPPPPLLVSFFSSSCLFLLLCLSSLVLL